MNKSYKKRFQKFSISLSDPALINYARQNGKNTFSGKRKLQLSIQGYLQQRKRLNPEIFPYPDRNCPMDFYHSDEPELWKGYLLVAIDGSKAEVPDSKENRETSANSGSQHSKTGRVRALVSGMYDILNHFYPDIETEHISVSENGLAERNFVQQRFLSL